MRDSDEMESYMVTEERLTRWERQTAVIARDLSQLASASARHTARIDGLEKDSTEIKIKLSDTVGNVNQQLASVTAKLQTQTKYSLLMICTLLPGTIALLWKIFAG